MVPQLLIAKRLFLEAATYVDREDPVSAGIAISLLQDAAELYVWTLIKERNITVKDQAGFVANLETLQKAGLAMPHAAKLLELNRARVGFKHYGNLPAPAEAGKHQTYVEDSLRQALQDHFGIRFDDLSLVDLVSNVAIRDQLRSAETRIAAGELAEAAAELAKAKTLTFGQMQKYLPKVDSKLRDTDRMLNMIDGVRGANPFTYLVDYLGVLREASLVAMLRLPLDDYAFLRNSLPSASQSMSGKWFVNHSRSSYTETECRRALTSIVNLCQRLQLRP